MKALQAIQVTVNFDKRPLRAVWSREALEAVASTRLAGDDAMLDAFRRHQPEIERIILARCVGSDKKAVIFWGAADIAVPSDDLPCASGHQAADLERTKG